MDLRLTEEQKMVQQVARDFALNEVKPLAAELDKTARFPTELIKRMSELGFMGIPFPDKYGGAGMDYLSYALVVEEISVACASTGVILSAHSSLCCDPIYASGTEEQKKKFLTPLANGQKIGCLGLTEPSAGSDVVNLKTTAVKDGSSWVVNGAKLFITNGGQADIAVIAAITDKAKAHKGISVFIVEKGTKGFRVGKHEEIAAQAVGIARAALEASVKYSKERTQFNQPISNFQAIQWMLADMATEIDAARLLTHRAALLKDTGAPYIAEAAMAKLFASETATRVTHKGIQIHGGYGYTKDYPMERFYRDARITEIYEGTSEIQRLVIANNLLK
ncbi:MAG: acyl-CoA dehydrogenase family protein [Planctomycetes bacterium]|nr:acyl-CoA dehydrogenase family protein [Planctomycetota bacterium]